MPASSEYFSPYVTSIEGIIIELSVPKLPPSSSNFTAWICPSRFTETTARSSDILPRSRITIASSVLELLKVETVSVP